MQDIEKIKEYADEWAYDMSLHALKGDGVVNVDVINQSIEMILTTPYTTRLFNLSFGSTFSLRVFDNMSSEYLETVIDDAVKAITRWEDRIFILEKRVKLIVNADKHSISLTIPYIIKDRNIFGEFGKVIRQ